MEMLSDYYPPLMDSSSSHEEPVKWNFNVSFIFRMNKLLKKIVNLLVIRDTMKLMWCLCNVLTETVMITTRTKANLVLLSIGL